MIPNISEAFDQYKKDILEENFKHLEECNTPNWDGEGAEPSEGVIYR
jgi:hypothetical protein